jgi:prevent-host-death family protein
MSISVNLKEDICPISDFRANTTSMLKKVREFHRPLVLTQNGKSSAIVLDIGDFQSLIDELELAKELIESKQQITRGESFSNEEVHQLLKDRMSDG